MTAQLTFPACVLPGCPNPVANVGEPCGECSNLFGTYLHATDRPALTAEQIDERDSGVRRAYALQRMTQEVTP